MKLKDIPEKIVEKARKQSKSHKGRLKYMYTTPQLPRKPEHKQVLHRELPSVEEGKLPALIKRLEATQTAAHKKGATKVVVKHRRIFVTAYRMENEREFQQRYDEALLELAEFLVREEQEEKKAAAVKKARSREARLDAMQQLGRAARKLGLTESKKIIEGLINGTK